MKKLTTFIQKIKILINRFIQDCKEETPKIWAWIRNLAAGLTLAITILSGVGATFPSLEVPYWFSSYGWYIAGICALITGYSAKQKVIK